MIRRFLPFCLALVAQSAAAAEPLPLLYWADAKPKETVIDVVVFDQTEGPAVKRLIEKYGMDGETAIPEGEPLVPARFKVGARFLVATTAGAHTVAIRARTAHPGAGEDHLVLHLDPLPTKARSGGVAMPAESVKQPSKLALRALRPGRLPGTVTKQLAQESHKGLSEADRDKLGKARLSVGDVRAFAGSFPAGLTWVVTITKKVSFTDYVAGMLFLRADGAVGASHAVPALGLNHYTPLFAIDLDGDGVEELVLDEDYYEGHYRVLLRWDGTAPKSMVLTGDGA